MAINKFEGGVVLVSHDERLIELCADELWHVERRQVNSKPQTPNHKS
jgi:ATPase subunit of ABC transporter with duplicated ATPase domains